MSRGKNKTPKNVSPALDTVPPGEYMCAEQQHFFRQRLEEMRANLLQSAEQTTAHLQDSSPTPDWLDRAVIEEEYTIELRVRDRERKLLHKIDQALLRIAEGQYGWCEETGEAIGLARLLARPTTTLSIEAQERREQRKRLYGD